MQPTPQPNDHPHIVDLVIEDYKERKEFGMKKYGTPLQAFNSRDSLQDLYEELSDATLYARQAIYERDYDHVGASECTLMADIAFFTIMSVVFFVGIGVGAWVF